MWVPLLTFSDHLQEHPCPCRSRDASLWDSPPLQGVFLPLSGWKPVCARVDGQEAAGQCVCVGSLFILIILVKPQLPSLLREFKGLP